MKPDLRCYHHPHVEATGQCDRCGDYLCGPCVNVYKDQHVCNRCLADVVERPKGRLRKWWRRHTNNQVTEGQTLFDVFAAVALPVLCVAFDPIVFVQGGGPPLGGGVLPGYYIGGYSAIVFAMVALMISLIFRPKSAFLGGYLAGSAMLAAGLGMVMLPVSLIGLFVLIGALGFSPFLTAFSLYRNGVRTLYRVNNGQSTVRARYLVILGAALALSMPLAAQIAGDQLTQRAYRQLGSDDAREQRAGRRWLDVLLVTSSPRRILLRYMRETDPDIRGGIAREFRDITGRDIDDAYERLFN